METVLDALQVVQLVVYAGLALAAVRHYRIRRGRAAAWLAVTLAILPIVVIVSRLAPTDVDTLVSLWTRKLVIAVLLLFPFALHRFMRALLPPAWRWSQIATALTVIVVGWALVLPDIPAAGEPRDALYQAFVFVVLVQWTLISLNVVIRLWTAGAREPIISRKRVRFLALGALAMNAAVLLSGLAGPEQPDELRLTTALVSILAAPLFYIGFAPPGFLRSAWRRPAERALHNAELALVGATTPREVAETIVPFLDEVFGGVGGLLADARGDLIVAQGLDDDEGRRIVEALEAGQPLPDNVAAVPLRTGWLAVLTAPVTPFFGKDELELLTVLGAFVDIALDRAELFERERRAREDVERASEELEGLVYGLSHDLKSPVVTILGYLDLLQAEYGGELDVDGRAFIERMQQSGVYMRELLNDLLELSRVGRTNLEVQDLDLGTVVSEVSESIGRTHPRVTVNTSALPRVAMNPVRARQLFTNLIENAVRHGGREDITVDVEAEAHEYGVRVYVRDNGLGIPRDDRERVFELFERLDQSETTGTGVGLAMCRKILEMVGGSIAIVSSDVGATFALFFPADIVDDDGTARVSIAS